MAPATSLTVARLFATTSWIVNLLAQFHGMTSTPSMKHIHETNISFYSPNATFIAAFFFAQQLVQATWLYRMWRARKPDVLTIKDDVSIMVNYTPYYALGNLCMTGELAA